MISQKVYFYLTNIFKYIIFDIRYFIKKKKYNKIYMFKKYFLFNK